MHIVRLTAYHVCIPLRQTVRHASHSRDATDSLILRCELEDETVGWGEGLPREYVTGETIDDTWSALPTVELGDSLGGPFKDSSTMLGCLEQLTLCPRVITEVKSVISESRCRSVSTSLARGCFLNSARCAIELSVLDAVCRREGRPLSDITHIVPETFPIRQHAGKVQYSGIITAMNPRQQLHSAFKQRIYGFRQCKVKVGEDGADDVATLRRIGRTLGKRVELRIDANEAWSCDAVVNKLERLREFGVRSVEQPVPHEDISGLADVRRQIDLPIMLDESLCSLTDAQRAIDDDLCDLFNIRLSKCGGFVNSLRVAVLARSAGLGYQLGCQVGETGILSAAGRHFATSVAGLRSLEGSYDRHLVTECLTHEDVTFGYGGVAPALTGPGLGITVDEAALARCTVRQQILWER